MTVSKLLFLGLVVLVCCVALVVSKNCTRVENMPSCVCRTAGGELIDLRPLSYNNGTPMFTDIQDPNLFLYSYNPCYPYTSGGCKDAYICQWVNQDSPHNIADNGTEMIKGNDDGSFYVSYNSQSEVVKGVSVALHCTPGIDTDTKVVALGDVDELLFFKFEIQSCLVCPGGCKETPAQIAGIAGLVIIIVCIIAFAGYCIIGSIINQVHFKASGTDTIPNKAFWMDLPLLVKDGCLLVVSPCRDSCGKRDEYSKM